MPRTILRTIKLLLVAMIFTYGVFIFMQDSNAHHVEKHSDDITKRFAAGFQRFQKHWFCAEHNIYADLQEGQNPLALVIACSDSRVDPVMLTDSHPGEMFVVRNVANLVPPYAPDRHYHGVSAALEYAVRHLKIKNIIVMGHSSCGGIHAFMEKPHEDDEFISVWMQIIRRAKEVVEALHPNASEDDLAHAYEQWGIRVSLENLLTFPWIRKAVDSGELELHGWYFDLHQGTLLRYDEESDTFVSLVDSCVRKD